MNLLEVKTKIDRHQHLKVAEFRKNIRTTTPHRHNSYVEFVFLTGGGGTHTIDGKPYRVTPPVLFIIRNEQVHHWELTGEPEGYVLIIKKQYIEDSRDKALRNLLAKVIAHTYLPIAPAAKNFPQFFALLLESWKENHLYRSDVTDGLLKALLGNILGYTQPLGSPIQARTDIYRRYEEMLGKTEALRNSVSHYAALLNTSPQNLNALCRKAAGQSAAMVLASHIVGEAKRLLHYTDMTVSEIATRFDFADGSHFSKYFKRHTGITPQAFRRLA